MSYAYQSWMITAHRHITALLESSHESVNTTGGMQSSSVQILVFMSYAVLLHVYLASSTESKFCLYRTLVQLTDTHILACTELNGATIAWHWT